MNLPPGAGHFRAYQRPAGGVQAFSAQTGSNHVKKRTGQYHTCHLDPYDGMGYSHGTTRVVGFRLRVLAVHLGREPGIPNRGAFSGSYMTLFATKG
jgi:hypothetical protein